MGCKVNGKKNEQGSPATY